MTKTITLLGHVLLAIATTCSASAPTCSNCDISGLLTWVEDSGGVFSSKQEIRLENPNDKYSKLGVFATDIILQGTVLATIPWDIIIKGDDVAFDDEEDEDQENDEEEDEEENHEEISEPFLIECSTVRNLVKELAKAKSHYAPYLNYLQTQHETPLPSIWSEEGKQLLEQVLGGKNHPENLIGDATTRLSHQWLEMCGGEESALQAAMRVQQYADDGVLIPLKDLYRHRNGPYYNVDTFFTDEGYQIVARNMIRKGEQIHDSINQCEDCFEFWDENYGTPQLFRDHGFIEPYPQTWTLPEGHFELEVEDNGVKQVFSIPKPDVTFQLSQVEETFKITWLEKPDFDNFPKAKSQLAGWLREKLRALQRLKALGEYEDVPLHEQKTIWDFHHAFITALQYAIQDMEQKINSTEIDPKWGLDHHYEDFRFEEDWISYNEQRCNSSEFTDFRHYDTYAIEQSNYQTMKWQLREADDDMCLHLDGMLQICSSYRPHYHEFFVHFTARYISQIKRVIFLGSGDAMLLHEILKYPQLEKVVGLELDQQVTRKSFQFFKTQPHYDDERVEWWYGDATKTLPLLPRDYWGTFDLVLVDLSETVVSMSVTGKHDIFEVISMLLKPEGILLENELYKEKMSKNFDHTIQIFYGSPKVCTQVLTMSSNQVDFLHYPIHNHGVDAFLLDPEQDSKEPFKYFHDYIKSNAQEQGKCQDDPENGGSNAATIEHGRTAGVLQIVEAENAGFGLKDHQEIQEAIYAAVTKEGLTPISSPSNDNGVVVVAMKEGYVVARMWPEHKYCAFDINLWGGFQKAFKLRSSLVEAVKSSSVSTYRIVVGGMNGASTWEEDQEVIGVEISQKRSCQMEALSDKAVLNQEILNVAMAETVALLDSTSADIVVAVACGIQGEDKCPMTDALAQHPRVKRVVTLWTCARLAKNIDAMWDLSKVHDCEKSLIGQLEEVFDSQGLKLDMLFIDNSAPYSMIQILNSIWRSLSHRNNWLKKDRYVFVTPFHKEERYHQGFLERYRREQHSSTLSTAELVFKGSEGTEMGLAVLVSGDDAPTRFYDVESKIRERLPNVAMEITSIIGGEFHPEKDLKYEGDEFTPDRYDFRPSQEQFLQQQPLGRQTIFQLDSNVEDALIFGDLSTSLEQTLEKMNYGPSRFDKFLDVGDGGLIVSIFPQGSVILVWDGRKHVDINLFSFDQNREKADTFVDTFTTLSGKTLQVSLRDDQPRGFGRVVSFTSEIESPNYITYGATES